MLFFIPSALVAIIIYIKKKLIKFRLAVFLAALGVIGALLGSYLVSFVDSRVLSKLFALLLLVMGVMQFRSENDKNSK